LIEAHVTVANLHKAEFAGSSARRYLGKSTQTIGFQDAALNHTKRASSGPGHALEKAAAVNAVVVVIVLQNIRNAFSCHAETSVSRTHTNKKDRIDRYRNVP